MQSVAIAFPAVCFSHGVTNYSCKAIKGAAPRLFIFAWGSVTVTPIHTPAICLSFTSQSVCPLPLTLLCYELIQSFVTSPSLSFLFCPSHPKRKAGGAFVGCCRNVSCQRRQKFISACSQPEGTGACWPAQQREVGKGGCISSLPTS